MLVGAQSRQCQNLLLLRKDLPQLPRQNLLFGDRITIEVADDELEPVEVVGHGRSKFFPHEGEGDLTEWNDVVGDTLHVWFTDSEVDSDTVLGHGTGEYRLPAVVATGPGFAPNTGALSELSVTTLAVAEFGLAPPPLTARARK